MRHVIKVFLALICAEGCSSACSRSPEGPVWASRAVERAQIASLDMGIEGPQARRS